MRVCAETGVSPDQEGCEVFLKTGVRHLPRSLHHRGALTFPISSKRNQTTLPMLMAARMSCERMFKRVQSAFRA